MTFKVSYNGYAMVEADTPEEAEDIFFEDGARFEAYEIEKVEEFKYVII